MGRLLSCAKLESATHWQHCWRPCREISPGRRSGRCLRRSSCSHRSSVPPAEKKKTFCVSVKLSKKKDVVFWLKHLVHWPSSFFSFFSLYSSSFCLKKKKAYCPSEQLHVYAWPPKTSTVIPKKFIRNSFSNHSIPWIRVFLSTTKKHLKIVHVCIWHHGHSPVQQNLVADDTSQRMVYQQTTLHKGWCTKFIRVRRFLRSQLHFSQLSWGCPQGSVHKLSNIAKFRTACVVCIRHTIKNI